MAEIEKTRFRQTKVFENQEAMVVEPTKCFIGFALTCGKPSIGEFVILAPDKMTAANVWHRLFGDELPHMDEKGLQRAAIFSENALTIVK